MTFDFTTPEGRKKACEQFAEALSADVSEENPPKDEAAIIAYRDEEHTCYSCFGHGGDVILLNANILAAHPELIEKTFEVLPKVMANRILNELKGE